MIKYTPRSNQISLVYNLIRTRTRAALAGQALAGQALAGQALAGQALAG